MQTEDLNRACIVLFISKMFLIPEKIDISLKASKTHTHT